MTAVIDSSVLVAVLTDAGSDGRWATAQLTQTPLAAPSMVMAEVANVLRRLEGGPKLSRSEATVSLRSLRRLDIELYPFAPLADRVWELRFNLTAYDAWYVALAESLGWRLVTLDRKMAGASGTRCEFRLPPRPEQVG
ncbi:type II toxin-antitoxin system VapC family toxin [Candidatus Poriferisodalis sp.]|uniref:type II toxin-antitoxin system VapC family toxin n=1 Tax=Candidatus Poriferisodalis sp. TaxID=3101277 RepID=UPI003B026ED0